ncbi:MAG: 2-oxoacid:acceptor oxidoreductase family protein [Candidatus Bathyarchaeia archaeon]
MPARVNVRFGGFGGQGIITSGVILGRAAIYDGKDAVQSQSYGQQARGGECRCDVIISDETIVYPLIDKADILVVMSRPALEAYIRTLKTGGCLILDTDLVGFIPDRSDIEIVEIPATKTASKLGRTIVANMVMLGALVKKTKIVSEEALRKAVHDTFHLSMVELNLKAVEEGMKLLS